MIATPNDFHQWHVWELAIGIHRLIDLDPILRTPGVVFSIFFFGWQPPKKMGRFRKVGPGFEPPNHPIFDRENSMKHTTNSILGMFSLCVSPYFCGKGSICFCRFSSVGENDFCSRPGIWHVATWVSPTAGVMTTLLNVVAHGHPKHQHQAVVESILLFFCWGWKKTGVG